MMKRGKSLVGKRIVKRTSSPSSPIQEGEDDSSPRHSPEHPSKHGTYTVNPKAETSRGGIPDVISGTQDSSNSGRRSPTLPRSPGGTLKMGMSRFVPNRFKRTNAGSSEELDQWNSNLPGGSGSQNASQLSELKATSDTTVDLTPLWQEIIENRMANERLQKMIDDLQKQLIENRENFMAALAEERDRMDRLEDQVIDQTELHQHEVLNMKQLIQDTDDKLQYQRDDRDFEIQEHIGSIETKISKLENQVQQHFGGHIQELDGVQDQTTRTLLARLINLALAIIQVFLVVIHIFNNIVMPFVENKVRICATLVMMIVAWHIYNMEEGARRRLFERFGMDFLLK